MFGVLCPIRAWSSARVAPSCAAKVALVWRRPWIVRRGMAMAASPLSWASRSTLSFSGEWPSPAGNSKASRLRVGCWSAQALRAGRHSRGEPLPGQGRRSVGVGLLVRGVLHSGVPGGDLGGGDVVEGSVGPGRQDGEAEQLRVERGRCRPNSSASHDEGCVFAQQKGSVTKLASQWPPLAAADPSLCPREDLKLSAGSDDGPLTRAYDRSSSFSSPCRGERVGNRCSVSPCRRGLGNSV
jgi:hypothetical protein